MFQPDHLLVFAETYAARLRDEARIASAMPAGSWRRKLARTLRRLAARLEPAQRPGHCLPASRP